MFGGPQTLIYRPLAQCVEHISGASLSLQDDKALAIQRTVDPSLALSASYAQIGAELLPEDDRPAYGGCVVLLWTPVCPRSCLFTARDSSGTYRILPVPDTGAEALGRALERLDGECARAFEAAASRRVDLINRLDAVLGHAAVATLLFGEIAAGRPFWQRAAS